MHPSSLTRRSTVARRFRRGAATVELAVCLPVLLTLVFGAIEGSNFIFLKQAITVAAYETAQVISDPGGTEAGARARADQMLAARSVDSATVEFTPVTPDLAKRGELVTVTVSAPASANSIGLSWFFSQQNVQTSVNMVKE